MRELRNYKRRIIRIHERSIPKLKTYFIVHKAHIYERCKSHITHTRGKLEIYKNGITHAHIQASKKLLYLKMLGQWLGQLQKEKPQLSKI